MDTGNQSPFIIASMEQYHTKHIILQIASFIFSLEFFRVWYLILIWAFILE